MDFDANLRSSSVRDQSAAAIFLRAEGANGAKYLPALLQKCQAIDANNELDQFEEALLGFGAMTMGDIVGAIGFNAQDPLHVSILRWLVQCTSSRNLNVAAYSIYGLGNLRALHPEATECLCGLVTSNRRYDDHKHVSLRAVALRILRRLDSGSASKFVGAPAFEEYAKALEHWIATDASKNAETRLELQNELEWLTEIKNRWTKP